MTIHGQFWDDKAQLMSRDSVRQLQSERLVDAVHRVYEHTTFFRRRYDEAGLRPDDVTGVEDLARIPTFTKPDLRRSEAEHPPFGDYRAAGIRDSVRLGTSTGTTGKPTFALWTNHDLQLEYEMAARAYYRGGVRPGMIVVNAHPGYLYGGQAIVSGTFEYMGCLSISMGPPSSVEAAQEALKTLESIEVDRWFVLPAAMARLREAAEAIGYVGLPKPDVFRPENQWDLMSAGLDCAGMVGSACEHKRGAHIAEDLVIVEALDPNTGESVGEGERGRMAVTSLAKESPMVRYDMEDVVRLYTDTCPCGEPSRRGFWDGRVKDLVSVAGRWILPIDVALHLPMDSEWVIVRRGPEADELTLRIEDPEPDLGDRLTEALGVPVSVERADRGALSRADYKFARVLDDPAVITASGAR